MNPAELIQERDTLRSQLRDAQEQAARDSATIARITAERDEAKALAAEIASNEERAARKTYRNPK